MMKGPKQGAMSKGPSSVEYTPDWEQWGPKGRWGAEDDPDDVRALRELHRSGPAGKDSKGKKATGGPVKGPSYFAACPGELEKRRAAKGLHSPPPPKKARMAASVDDKLNMSLDTAIEEGVLLGASEPSAPDSSSAASSSSLPNRPLSEAIKPKPKQNRGCVNCYQCYDGVCPCSCHRKPGKGASLPKNTRRTSW